MIREKFLTMVFNGFCVMTILGQPVSSEQIICSSPIKNFFLEFYEKEMFYGGDSKIYSFNNHKTRQIAQLKYGGEFKQKLDSAILESWDGATGLRVSKDEFKYNDDGNMTLFVYYEWEGIENDWLLSEKEEFTYDGNDNVTLQIRSKWNETENNWKYNEKEEYTYDYNGNIILIVNYSWRLTDWIPIKKEEYTYDVFGNIMSYVRSIWNDFDNKLIPNEKDEYSYNANGNCILWVNYKNYFLTSDPSWYTTGKKEYTYDANGNKILCLKFEWRDNDWHLYYKEEYAYDIYGNCILWVNYYDWGSTGYWNPEYKEEYFYDVDGNMIKQVGYEWKVFKGWISDYYEAYTYDESGNITLYELFAWQENTTTWIPKEKLENIFNYSFSLNDLLMFPSESVVLWSWFWNLNDFPLNMLSHSVYYCASDNTFVPWFKADYYYSEFNPGGITDNQEETLLTYPNPASETITFCLGHPASHSDIELYDVYGRKVLDQLLPENSQISIKHLNKGIYLYKLYLEGYARTGKIMIE